MSGTDWSNGIKFHKSTDQPLITGLDVMSHVDIYNIYQARVININGMCEHPLSLSDHGTLCRSQTITLYLSDCQEPIIVVCDPLAVHTQSQEVLLWYTNWNQNVQ